MKAGRCPAFFCPFAAGGTRIVNGRMRPVIWNV
jgi:hypothetical protein